jgi:four helix bundle protein
MEDFKDLRVWGKAHELTLAAYQKTRAFPKEEMYGLTSQLRRASASVGETLLKDAADDRMQR